MVQDRDQVIYFGTFMTNCLSIICLKHSLSCQSWHPCQKSVNYMHAWVVFSVVSAFFITLWTVVWHSPLCPWDISFHSSLPKSEIWLYFLRHFMTIVSFVPWHWETHANEWGRWMFFIDMSLQVFRVSLIGGNKRFSGSCLLT